MDPITIAIATAIGGSLVQVGGKLVEKGVVEPALKPASDKLARLIGRGYDKAADDIALQKAVEKALASIGVPVGTSDVEQYAINLGFDQLRATPNESLRQEIGQATLLLTAPDPQLIPESLFEALRWPHDARPYLARFLYTLRQELALDTDWAPLIEYADKQAVQNYLRQQSRSLKHIETYLQMLLAYYNLTPDTSEAAALRRYLAHVAQAHRSISFLFIKPAGRRDQLKTQAELETVFVPLQVHDPDKEEKGQRLQRRRPLSPEAMLGEEGERQHTLTINEVLAKYPVFLLKGQPGSGKTTLLRHVAISFARNQAEENLDWTGEPLLPILVPLRNFGRFLQANRAQYTSPAPQPLREFIEDYFREYDLDLPPNFFRQRLQQGRCLLLLDGLDEVADRDLRAEVAQIVSSFVKTYGRNGNRFGLASRPRGYDEVAAYFRPEPVICTVQDLSPESRDKLVYNLLYQFTPNDLQCRRETEALLRDIRAKRRVDELSRNPLFCTTLVLVYKYRKASLPERRVDVYQELVTLMLGFWEMQREGVAAVRELALEDGTGRAFLDENEAVEAKERALIAVADWMQYQERAEVDKKDTIAHLANYFAEREGAKVEEKEKWARGFLIVAHQRSGLFVEVEPEIYAFSHQNFREYLAATALVNRTDKKMVAAVLAQAENSWWHEVILLAAAHERLSAERREMLLEEMLAAGAVVLAGQCAVDAGARLPAPMKQEVIERLYQQMTDAAVPPQARAVAGEALDALGWLPDDFHRWIRCPARADSRHDLLVMKYPLTNAQFEQFMADGGYDNPAYWGKEESEGWQWRINPPDYRQKQGQKEVAESEYWQDTRLGRERPGYPVVGISWYEAVAYMAWLTELLRRVREGDELPDAQYALIADLVIAGATDVRLPTETEWVTIAGGEEQNRYPWDKVTAAVTKDEVQIVQRANVRQTEIGNTSPVGMYPQGASQPFDLMDMAGNVWEWTTSWGDEDKDSRVLRGGSWRNSYYYARVSARYHDVPHNSNYHFGCRGVAPVLSGS